MGIESHPVFKPMIEEAEKKKLLAILKRPTFFNDICEEFKKKVAGEEDNCKVIFLCAAGGRLVENASIASFNLLVNDDAGVGKDHVVNAVLSILPKEHYIHKSRISPTTFTYWHTEPDWNWDGKIFYPEDISENVLNSDVFKVMCSSGSSAVITIKNKAVEIDIKGKPVMITTTATATPNPELIRRFAILNLDSSEPQTKRVMKRQAEYKKNGIIPEYYTDFTHALNLLKRVKVKIPYSDLISDAFPSKNVIMRTNFSRFLDFICASAALHQFQRKEEAGFILAQGEDYDAARECFLKLCSNKYMIPLTINQKKILSLFEKEPFLKGSVSNLHSSCMNFLSIPALQTNLGILVKYGILETETEKDSLNRDIEKFKMSGAYNPNERLEIPTFKELQDYLNNFNNNSNLNNLNNLNNPSKEGVIKDIKDVKAIKCLNKPANLDKITCPSCQLPAYSGGFRQIGEEYYCLKCAAKQEAIK